MASITLAQFERIDSLLSDILRMGAFETCAEPRVYIRTENRLYDALEEAMGRAWTDQYPATLEAAAQVVTMGLLSATFVTDEVEG